MKKQTAGWIVVTLTLVLGLLAGTAQAADGTWITDGDGDWTDGGNWSEGTIADGTGFTANFTAELTTATRTVTLTGDRTIGNITFTDGTTSSHNLSLSGDTLTLDVSSSAPTINVTQSDRTLTIGSAVAGNDGLTKINLGTLTLTAGNTYTGTTSVNGGTLQLGDNGSLASTSIALNGGTLTLDNTINNSGNRVSDSATVTVNGNSGLRFTHAGTAGVNYSETLDILSLQSGFLTYNGSQAHATGPRTSNLSFNTLSRSGTATVNFSGTNLGASAVANAGRNTIKFGAGVTSGQDLGPWAVVNGDLVQDWSVSVGFAGYDSTRGIIVQWAPDLAAGSNDANTNYGQRNNITISASTNPSYKTLHIATTGDRTLTVNGNTISVGGISAAVASTTHTISSGGTLQTLNAGDDLYINVGSKSLTINSVIRNVAAGSTASGLVKFGAGTLLLNAANTFTGGTTLSAGTLTMSNAGALGSTSGQLTVNGGTLNMASQSLTVGNLTGTGGIISGTSAGTRTLTIGQGNGTGGIFQGQINNGAGGTTALTKTGTGTITLSGTNGYTGGTSITGGTLKLGANDVIPNASNVSIGTATLDADTRADTAGTLAVTGAAVINLGSGAALAFADSKGVDWTGGTLNITGTLEATSLRFGDSDDDLTSGQLAKISVNGSGLGTYILDANGYLVTAALDVTPPTLSSLNPANNATDVHIGANLVATFSENISIGTGNITLKNLTDSTQADIDVADATQVSISGAVLTINPTANLLGEKNYAVQIAATAIDDLSGNSFDGIADNIIWNFTTATPGPAATLYFDGGAADIDGNGNGASAGGAGTWNTTIKNWDAGAVPHVAWNNLNGDNAVIAGSGLLSVGEAVTVGTLTLNYTTGTRTVSDAEITVNSGINFGSPAGLTWTAPIKLGGNQTWSLGGSDNTAKTIQTGGTDLNGYTLTWDCSNASSGNPYHRKITGNGSIVKNGTGRVYIGGADGQELSYTGSTTVNAGSLYLEGWFNLGNATNQLTVNGGTLDLRSNSLSVGNLTGTGGIIDRTSNHIGTLTIGQGDFGGGNFQGSIRNTSGTTHLTKTGTGTITLSGANTYTGLTSINGGTLVVTGTIVSNVTVGAAGSLSPVADGAGTLAIGGNLDILAMAGGTGKLKFELGAPAGSNDRIDVTGTLTIGTGVLDLSDFDFTDIGGMGAGTYILITSSGGISGTPDTSRGPVGLLNNVKLDRVGNNLVLIIPSQEPQPSVFRFR